MVKNNQTNNPLNSTTVSYLKEADRVGTSSKCKLFIIFTLVFQSI